MTEERSGMHYRCVEDLLLQHGTFWEPQPLPEKWKAKIDAWPKACFDNSYRLARKSRGQLRYVEGMATGVIAVEHAWCVDQDGRVVDLTWGSFRTVGMGASYMGVAIPLDVVKLYRSKHNTSALHHWQGRYPLLQKPFEFPQGNNIR